MNQDYYILSNYISFQRNQMIAIENILNLFVSINEQTERILNRYYERNQTTTNIRRRSNRSTTSRNIRNTTSRSTFLSPSPPIYPPPPPPPPPSSMTQNYLSTSFSLPPLVRNTTRSNTATRTTRATNNTTGQQTVTMSTPINTTIRNAAISLFQNIPVDDFLSPVPIIPTATQITNATELISFRDISSNQTICPVSMENFEANDIIIRIRHCGHIFKHNSLLEWFRTSSLCPVCRHNIREN